MKSNAPLHCNDLFKLQGGGSVSGDVSSSVGIKLVGGPSVIGDVTSPTPVQGVPPGTIDGVVTIQPVPPITIPDIDLTPYFNAANDNETTMEGAGPQNSLLISDPSVLQDIVDNGGILWVDGDLKITVNGTFAISIFATGDIEITSDFNQKKVEGYPAIASRDGDIDLSGNGTFEGLIYAKTGDISKTGSGLVTGTLVCAGDFYKGGGWSAMSYEDSEPVPPEGYEDPYDDIGVSAWQK
jgi:cytoskeletal protein CcmA (bactofilin family)